MNQDSQQDPSEAATTTLRFDTLPLDPKLLRAVCDSGYTALTPIQAKAIPIVLDGRDVMGAAQTGTGKTAAFTLPLLQKMLRHENASMSPARHPVRLCGSRPAGRRPDRHGQDRSLRPAAAAALGGGTAEPAWFARPAPAGAGAHA